MARPGHAGRLAPARRDPARVAADRPDVHGRGRAALLGDDRRPAAPLRPARRVCEEVRRGPGLEGGARDLPLGLLGGESESPLADDRAPGPRLDDRRARRLRRSRHARQPGAAVGQGPRGGSEDPAPRDRGGQGERSRSDSPALDVEARQGDPEGSGSPRQHRVSGGQAPARCGRELARPPARGERREADPGREGAAARGRRGPPRLLRGVHAAGQQCARPGTRGARRDPRDRKRARRQSARAEGAVAQVAQAQAQEEGRRTAAAAAAAARRRGRRCE